MYAEQLIKDLKKMKKKFGNLPVRYFGGDGEKDVFQVKVYDKDGFDATSKKTAYEFYIL